MYQDDWTGVKSEVGRGNDFVRVTDWDEGDLETVNRGMDKPPGVVEESTLVSTMPERQKTQPHFPLSVGSVLDLPVQTVAMKQ